MHLLEARAKKRKTQWDLKISTGINQTKLSLIERGYIVPSEREKRIIAQSLGFEIREIDWAGQREDSDG
jgi:DNA-binding XRE family transcriptional regulator